MQLLENLVFMEFPCFLSNHVLLLSNLTLALKPKMFAQTDGRTDTQISENIT